MEARICIISLDLGQDLMVLMLKDLVLLLSLLQKILKMTVHLIIRVVNLATKLKQKYLDLPEQTIPCLITLVEGISVSATLIRLF